MNLIDPSPSLSSDDSRSRATHWNNLTDNNDSRRRRTANREERKLRDPLISTPGSEHRRSSTRYFSDGVLSPAYSRSAPPPPPPSPSTGSGEGSVKIFPGFRARWRGARETWRSIEDGDYIPITCLACTLNLCCIMDADYVICPCCQGITPVADTPTGHGGGRVGDQWRYHQSKISWEFGNLVLGRSQQHHWR